MRGEHLHVSKDTIFSMPVFPGGWKTDEQGELADE